MYFTHPYPGHQHLLHGRAWTTCAISVCRNDMKYKYNLIFFKTVLHVKGWQDTHFLYEFLGIMINLNNLEHELQIHRYFREISQGPILLTLFHHNSNSMKISLHSHLHSNPVIDTKFCTWHDSFGVVAWAVIYWNLMASNRITAMQIFHWI